MYPEYIRNAAQTMAENMAKSEMPLYGESLRLPDRKAVIALIKEIRRLMFPAYFGDATLMTLAPEDYAALLLDRVERSLRRQIALALPEEEAHRADTIAREFIDCLPTIQSMLLKDLDATRQLRIKTRSSSPIRVSLPFSSTASPTSCTCARSP